MKVYEYINAKDIDKYDGWTIEKVIPHENGDDMLIISRIKISNF